jgi:hypothetical protein
VALDAVATSTTLMYVSTNAFRRPLR